MTRLILISFAILGWTFYVMSGGSNFEPRGMRSEQPVRLAAKPAPEQPTDTAALVANVTTRTPVVGTQPVAAQTAALEVPAEATSLEALNGISITDDPAATITLASLEDGVAGLTETSTETTEDTTLPAAQPELPKDIREISGTRVNMRDGPGTIYPIVGKATIGQKVEVLSDSGTGWLRLRVLPQQQVGWISTSLVRKTAN